MNMINFEFSSYGISKLLFNDNMGIHGCPYFLRTLLTESLQIVYRALWRSGRY
jgi:hypothetical protein